MVTNMSYEFEIWNDELKTKMHSLIDYLFENGVSFSLTHTFGFNEYERDKGEDQIKLVMFKRYFGISLTQPKFYMVHDHLGDGCKRVIDRTEFKTFEEMRNKIEELTNE